LCTDGPYFGFVPVQSALDYGRRGTLGLATNIERLDINTKLANIPARADVMIGNAGRNGTANREHLGYRNDNILNVSNNIPPFGNFDNTYFSCINQTPTVVRGFLNLEIGDEELYLENNTLPFTSQYQVEYDIHLNERNRYYQYPSTVIGSPAANQILAGIYSKQDVYAITNTGFATFIYDVTLGLPLNHLGFFGTATGNFAQIDQPLINCCINFIGAKGVNSISKIETPKELAENYLKVSPNPINGELLTLKYQFKTQGNVQLTMVDAMGKQVYSTTLFIPIAKQQINSVIDIRKLKLPTGVYFIRLGSGKEILSNRLIVIN
jgi:hypothetical protein